MPKPTHTIAHIDMDAFFAAVEQRDHPELNGMPVVIGADPKKGAGRGVVSTCSYEARTYGIHSAMPISIAYKLCPKAVFLPVDMKRYAEASEKVFDILYDFTPDIEPISIDEAFLDITGTIHLFKTARALCEAVKKRIKKDVGLTASIGIAPNKMTAKIASDFCKPDGLLEVSQDGLFEFLWPLGVERLWGVGPKSMHALHNLGITTIGDLAHASSEMLIQEFGEAGRHIFELANGIDDRTVELDDTVKSVSNEHTFETDTNNMEALHTCLLALSEKVSRRLRKSDLKGKTISIKIRLAGFKTYTRAFTLAERTNFADTIYKKARELFDAFYSPWMKIRLVGVKVSQFDDAYVRDTLFLDTETEKKERMYTAVDRIKDKFGEGAITHGTSKEVD